MVTLPFPDRESAGRDLGAELVKRQLPDPVVYALPRGGVPVAVEIANALNAPLDLVLVRKLGVPWQPELAAGSIVDGERPEVIYNDYIVRAAGVSREQLDDIAAAELREIERRREHYLPNRAPLSAKDKTAILVDDGIATGASMRAAVMAVRHREPKQLIVATPVAPADTAREFAVLVDLFVALATPEVFYGVGAFYRDFHQLDDAEVMRLLAQHAARPAPPTSIGADTRVK